MESVFPIKGLFFDPKICALYILMPKELSLFSFLHSLAHKNLKKTPMTKKNIALGIASAIKEIHSH
jgi:hypothetical protein